VITEPRNVTNAIIYHWQVTYLKSHMKVE